MPSPLSVESGPPVVFGRGLLAELASFANYPFLIVTMPDLWETFRQAFAGAAYRLQLVRSVDQSDLEAEAGRIADVRSVVGLGGGRALDAAKYLSWRRGLPLFQVPTALSVDAVFSQRAAVREGGKVVYRGFAVPSCIFIDYDVLRSAPPMLNWSGAADVLCFHTAVLDWRYARDSGTLEPKWPYDDGLAKASLAQVDALIDAADDVRRLTDHGIEVLTNGLEWGGASFLAAGWNPRHIEGTEHFVFYALEAQTGRSFLHGQPVGLGVVIGSMLHEEGVDLMVDTLARIGLDVRPPAMGLSWDEVETTLTGLRAFVNGQPLWRSIAHDVAITPGFISDLKRRLAAAFPD